jgi:putative peptidoglycan lipid II flippase
LLPWPGSWSAGGPGRHEQNLGPFPLAPVTETPTDKQSRGVILVLVGVLVLVLGFAVWSLKGLAPDTSVFGPGPTFTPVPLKPSETGAAAGAGGPAAARPVIKGVASIDPYGDNREHPETVERAFDGDPDSVWKTEEYKTSDLSGKKGVGLVLDLGRTSTVRQVTVSTATGGGRLELRTLGKDDKPGSTVLAGAEITADGAVLAPRGGTVVQRYLVIWCTEVPEVSAGKWRLDVSEISVR